MASHTLWRELRERGSVWGMFLTAMVYRFFGRWLAEPLLCLVVAYFFLTDGRLRKSSAQYLSRVHGRPYGRRWIQVYRHCLSFARTSLDRLDVWTNRLEKYTFNYFGEAHLVRLRQEGKGAVLISAHLGSFDTLRALAKRHNAKVHVLTDFRNSRRVSSVLKRFCPGMDEGVVAYDTTSISTIFELQQAVRRGEFVALLGDRIAAETARGAGRVSSAIFLGEKALFPQAAFIFAAHMECPVYLMFGLRRSVHRYDLYVEPFADPVELPDASRENALANYIAAYASRLEHYCRLYPLQWFNFYDFWRQPS